LTTDQQTGLRSDERTGLRSNALGLLGAATLGAIMLSPALGIYGNFAAMESTAGVVTSLLFLIAMFIALPTAISYAMVARDMPAAGSAYTWLWQATRPGIGVWVGWLMKAYYIVVLFLQPIIFGLFFNELVRYLGFTPSNWTYALGVLLVTAIVMPTVYRSINVSARTALLFMLFEMATILALTITIFVVRGSEGHLTAAPLNPAAATGGWNAIFQGVLFGILSYTGFDVVSTVAEETKTPRSLVPVATIVALLIVGAFWILCSWAFSIAIPPAQVAKLADQGLTPITPIAQIFWGRGDIIVTITGMTAATGTYLAGMTALGRVVFAMGRDGTLPGWFSYLHPRFQSPWNVLHTGFALVGIVCILIAAIAGPYNVWIWCGESTVFFAVMTYLFVNIANFVYYRRYRAADFNWLLNGIVPAIGVVVLVYILYRSFFTSLWGGGFALGQSVVLFALFWTAVGAAYAFYLARSRPDVLRKQSVYQNRGPSSD
jgi:amino acid transporter